MAKLFKPLKLYMTYDLLRGILYNLIIALNTVVGTKQEIINLYNELLNILEKR